MSESRPLAYWATVDLYRTYLFEDGPFLQAIADRGGRVDRSTLSRIARSYSVSRTIPAGSVANRNLDLFVTEITSLAKSWPRDFQARARACREVAGRLAQQFDRRQTAPGAVSRSTVAPHSAVTKFIWFLKPVGWTVYDSLAASAVLKHGGNTEARQQRFYETVEQPFVRLTEDVRPALSVFNAELHPERLLDKFLVLKGSAIDRRDRVITQNKHFLRLLPGDFAASLEKAGNEIAVLVRDDAFPPEAGKRPPSPKAA